MPKQYYRTVESLLDKIDHSTGDEAMLVDILHLLVKNLDTDSFGVKSGRLFRERETDYLLIESLGDLGATIAGKTINKNYQLIKDIERHRLWVMSPTTPGWDPELESQFVAGDSAAIIVGRDPAYILSLGIRHHGSEDDLRILLETIRAAVGLKLREEALVSQLRQAQTIQHSLLPARLTVPAGFDIAALSHPAEEVGGDVYDVQEVEAGVVGLMLADASGHGLPAALQARDVVIGMRMGQAKDEKISATISHLNKVIHGSGLASRFVSLFYGELEETGNMTYVNCGHCPPLLLTPGQEVFELPPCGPVLGPLPDAVYRRGHLTIRPGETLIIFSDGVTERQGPPAADSLQEPPQFGTEQLIQVGLECLNMSAKEIAEEIVNRVRRFGAGEPFDDDVSIMVVKRLPQQDYSPAESLVSVSSPEGSRR